MFVPHKTFQPNVMWQFSLLGPFVSYEENEMLLVNGVRDTKPYRVFLSLMEYGLCSSYPSNGASLAVCWIANTSGACTNIMDSVIYGPRSKLLCLFIQAVMFVLARSD